jgi:hypothetical protein
MKRKTTMSMLLAVILSTIGGAVAVRAAEPADPVAAMLADYGTIHDALADDRVDGVVAAAAKIAERATDASGQATAKDAYLKLVAAAGAMTGSDVGSLRNQLYELSRALAGVVAATGSAGADLYYCPMAEGYWLQKKGDGELRNPYYGKSMLSCGSKVEKVED